MKEILKTYIEAQAINDVQLAEGLKNEKKTYDGMENYIINEAKKHLDNKNGAIKDDIIYGWAVHYWTDYVETDVIKPKPTHTPNPPATYVNDDKNKSVRKRVNESEKKKEIEQLTLFDMV